VSETTQLPELLSLRDYLRFAVSRFREAGLTYGHGTTSALDDAAFLILETLHLPIDSLDPWLDARLTRAERQQLATAIEQRVVTRKPSAYITRSAYLGPHRFYVDERVIVPRSFLAELMLAAETQGDLPFGLDASPLRILDLCTGSGCLAILAAHMFPHADVTAVELSAPALAVAQENIKRHSLEGRLTLVEGNLFGALGTARFDLILSNPPYVTADAVQRFPAEHQAEPAMAHLGGADGMDIVRRILAGADDYLTPGGTLVVEVGQGRDTLEATYPQLPFLWLDTELSEAEVFMLPAEALRADKKQAEALRADNKPTAKRARPRSSRGT
jgi:ribosomal protein L3 glutamine methyltransferase